MTKVEGLNLTKEEINKEAEKIIEDSVAYLTKEEVIRRNAILTMSDNYSHEEYVDYLDENGNFQEDKNGIRLVVLKKKKAHKEGIPHREIHISVINSNGKEILLQQRVDSKDLYPGYWDITVGGHVAAYEETIEAAKRELEEELGIPADMAKFELLFGSPVEEELKFKKTNNKAFVTCYIYIKDINQNDIKLQEDEVQAAKWVKADEFKKLIDDDIMIPHKKENTKLLELLRK